MVLGQTRVVQAESARTPWLIVLASIAFAIPGEPRRVAIRVDAMADAARAIADDVWNENGTLDIVVTSDDLVRLAARGVQWRVIVDDLDAVAGEERRRLASRSNRAWFAEYRDVDEIDAFLDRLASERSEAVDARVVGRSHEGRAIHAVRVSRGGTTPIVIDGGHHAREWLSLMVPLCIADRWARSEDPRIRRVLGRVALVVAPLVNPDGYAYSWTTDRYWRKNRNGEGVDLARNYSVGWGGASSSGDPSSPNYRGEDAFSEPETRAVRRLFEPGLFDEWAGRPVAHVDFHAYSQVIV